MAQQTPKAPARYENSDGPQVADELFDFSETEARIHNIYDRLRGSAPEKTHAGTPPIMTIPENQPLAHGTKILIAGAAMPLSGASMFRFLDDQRAAIPDLVLVHTGGSGPASIAEEWAIDRNVPQIIYPPDPYGETDRQRSKRQLAIFDVTPPEHVYDFSHTGRRTPLSEIADTRNVPVTVMRHMLQYAYTRAIENDPIHPRPTVAPGIPATRGEMRELAQTDHQYDLDQLRAQPSRRIHPLAMQDPRALGPTFIEGARPPFDGHYFVVTGSTTSPDPAAIFCYLDRKFPVDEPDSPRPDLIFIHTGESPAERAASDWAAANAIPQIVYARHPNGETLDQRSARLHTLLDHAFPRTVYDFSAPGERSDLAIIARNHHHLVIRSAERIHHALAQASDRARHDRISTGTPILVTGAGTPPNREALFGLLDRVRKSIPDMTLVHTDQPGPPTLAREWAENRNVPQLISPPDPAGETRDQRTKRYNSILNGIKPVRIYDFTEPGQHSELAEHAKRRERFVSESRSVVEQAPEADRDASISQGVSPGGDVDMANRSRISHSY
ncbi:MAG: SLOG family protein [Defluviicoccus sp.]|nr:SLOG family protein [Defluviicoccus sp.]MDE0279094.1 SLOG family protein [Defluviicoccus sp.]